jgi:hypothetical protein
MLLRLPNASLGLVRGTGFDVHLTDAPKAELRRSDPSFVGSVSTFRHGPRGGGVMHNGMAEDSHETFDVTRAVAAVKHERLEGLSLVLVPYPLLAMRAKTVAVLNNREALQASGIEFLRMQLK